jgi:hypothetical protein
MASRRDKKSREISMFNRRFVTGGLLAAGASPLMAPSATRAAGAGLVPQGAEAWSESAMVLYFDPEVRNGFSVRISRYPDNNATWVWCHLLMNGQLYAFTERAVPCAPNHTDPEAGMAVYDCPGLKVSIRRQGSSVNMKGLAFTAQVKAHRGKSGMDGPGESAVTLEGVFHPGPLKGGSPKGRYERTGVMEATLTAGGKTVPLKGVGKAHEQTQTAPRFTDPFTYAMLWGPQASMIGLLSPARGYGDVEVMGKDVDMEHFHIEAWAPTRRFVALMKDGSRVEGKAETLQRYEVPIWGQEQWHGRIVRAEVAGKSVVGMINDWRPEKLMSYGLT